MMRQNHQQTLTIAACLAVLFGLAAPLSTVQAGGLSPLYVTDALTGVALDGMDPVSYFTETEPLAGKPDYEYDWQGVPWYFVTAANRDVFIKAPEVYAPQFGGHATTALARGYLSDGNAQIFLVVADRLYLFYSGGNRDDFVAAPAATIAAARARWVALTKPSQTAATAP